MLRTDVDQLSWLLQGKTISRVTKDQDTSGAIMFYFTDGSSCRVASESSRSAHVELWLTLFKENSNGYDSWLFES